MAFALVFLFPIVTTIVPVLFGQYQSTGNAYYQQQANGYSNTAAGYVESTPNIIDNGVSEPPSIRCTDRSVEFSINTRNPFRGNIYVQGQFGLPECRREFYNNDAPHAAIEVRLNDCGMLRERKPHGMSYSLVIITNFHPRFVTKVDRAYQILCSYQHAERPVGVDLEVGGVRHAGEELQGLRWRERQWTLIDDRGCPTSNSGVIQSPPVYSDSLNMASAPIFAFHFPDRTQMNFRCQIQSCNKMDNECVGLTPPNCPQSYGPNLNVDPRLNTAYGNNNNGYASVQPYIPQEASPTGYYPANGANSPFGQPQTYMGAGVKGGDLIYMSQFSPNWPHNAIPLKRVLQGNPSQVLQGISRPLPRRRMDRKEGQSLEHKILMATQQLRRHDDGRWPPGLMILNRTQAGETRRNVAAGTARRFFRPSLPESEQEELRRQRRAEEKTQDVVATSTVINDGLQGLEWSFENGKEQIRPRTVHNLNNGGPQQRTSKLANSYCLDRSTLVALVAALGLLSALVLSMFCYLLWDFFLNRHRCRKGLISWRGHSSDGLLSKLRKKGQPKRDFSFAHSNPSVSIVPMPEAEPMPSPPVAAANVGGQQGAREVLAGILNAGLGSRGQQRVPPPVPPKGRNLHGN